MAIIPDDIKNLEGQEPQRKQNIIYEYIKYMREQIEFWAQNRLKDITNLFTRVADLEANTAKKSGDTFTGPVHIDEEDGTASSDGYSQLYLGNPKPSGTAGNSRGEIILFSKNANYAAIEAAHITSDRWYQCPDASGTFALTDDIGVINKGYITNIGGSLEAIGNWIKANLVNNRWIVARVNPNASGYFGTASFDIMANCSSGNYGWGYVHSDNPTGGGHLFFRLAGGTFNWSRVMMQDASNYTTTLISPTRVNIATTLSDTGLSFTAPDNCMVEVRMSYNNSNPFEIALATKGANNIYGIIGISHRDNTGVTVSPLCVQAYVQKGISYYILAKGASAAANDVSAYILYK